MDSFRTRILIPIAILFFSKPSEAQTVSNYFFSSRVTAYENISGGITPALSGGTANEGYYNSIPIGFDFWYLGTKYNVVAASTNGWLGFGNGSTSVFYPFASNALNTSNTSLQRPILAPLWDDLDFTESGGGFRYKTTGTSPTRVFTAEWYNAEWGWTADSAVISFQVVLYETTGRIEFLYKPEAAAAVSANATIGISGTTASTYQSLNSTVLPFTSSLTSSSNLINTKPVNGQAFAFQPPMPLAPLNLSFTTVTPFSMQLNWADSATNEAGYLIYISSDNINFNLLAQTSANATSYLVSGLLASSLYYYKIYALSEGQLSSPLSGVQQTGQGLLSGIKTIPGDYPTITAALQDIPFKGLGGPLVLELQSNYISGGETFPITFSSTLGTSVTRSITICPAANASGLIISASNLTAIFNLNGSNNIIIDGRPGRSGTIRELTVSNSNPSSNATAITIKNDASNDTIRYCNVTGNGNSVINILSNGTITGCDNNCISDCEIYGGSTYSGTLITASGSGTGPKDNNANTIANNYLHDFISPNAQQGIALSIGSSCDDFRVTGNHIYLTQSLTSSLTTSQVTVNGVVFANTNGAITISGNYIGGSDLFCEGRSFEAGPSSILIKVYPIQINASSTQKSVVDGNVIRNFRIGSALVNTSGQIGTFSGIAASGNVNISNNIIGSGNESAGIKIICEGAGNQTAFVNGIFAQTNTSNINISKNTIVGLNGWGPLPKFPVSVCGIYATCNVVVIDSNIIQSLTASNNSNGQSVFGIVGNSNTNMITGNRISDLLNKSASAGTNCQIGGVITSVGKSTVTGNIIQNLYSASTNALSGTNAALRGISVQSNFSENLISGNIIRNLNLTDTSAQNSAYGIYYNGAAQGTAFIKGNSIFGLGIASTLASSNITGIYLENGSSELQNNLIHLGIDAKGKTITNAFSIYGVDKLNLNDLVLVHNSIYIGGSNVSGEPVPTSSFRNSATGKNKIYNNIFCNTRRGATGDKNYSAIINPIAPVSMDNNLHYTGDSSACRISVNNTNYFDFELYTAATLFDINGGTGDPHFMNTLGISDSINLHIDPTVPSPVEGTGTPSHTLETDFDGQMRSLLSPVDIGADAGNFISGPLLGIADPGIEQMKPLVYPNPFQDNLTITLPLPIHGVFSIQLFDALGRLVLNDEVIFSGEASINLRTPVLEEGIYLMRINSENEILQSVKLSHW